MIRWRSYKKDVDSTLLRENLKLTDEERIRKAEAIHASIALARSTAWRVPFSAAAREDV
jgi:hypothetical protein